MILIDSNIWIFAETEGAEEHKIAAEKVQKVMSSEGFGVNLIVVSEVYHILSRLLDRAEAGRRVLNIIQNPAAQWLDLDKGAAERGISLASKSGIRINDALIAQQAIKEKIQILTDNVKDFKRIKDLGVISLH